MTNKSDDYSTPLRLRFEAIYNGSPVDFFTQLALTDKVRKDYKLPHAYIGTPINYSVPQGASTILDDTPMMLQIYNRDNSHFILQATYMFSVATDLRFVNSHNIVSREQFREECGLEPGYSDSLAYGFLYLELDKGGSIVTGTTIEYNGIDIDLLLHIEWPDNENDSLEEAGNKVSLIHEYRTTPDAIDLTGAKPFVDWKGNRILERIIQKILNINIDWQELPLMELAKLILLPDDTRITRLFYKVFLSTDSSTLEEYATYDSCDFPNAMARQMADDKRHDMTVKGVLVQICGSFIYPNGNEDKCYVMNGGNINVNPDEPDPMCQPNWDYCSVGIEWQADHHHEHHDKKFARPNTDAADRYPVIKQGSVLSLSGMEMVGEWGQLFCSIIIESFDDKGITIRYGNRKQRIGPGKRCTIDSGGMNYTSFELSIFLGRESEQVKVDAPTETKHGTTFYIEDGILKYCDVGEPTVVVPEGVTTIATGAFLRPLQNNQYTLRHITLPSTVTSIGDRAFYNCVNLESIEILGPATLGREVFLGCVSLHDVQLADGVKAIGDECFAGCKNLKTLFIPSSVEKTGCNIAGQINSNIVNPTIFCHNREKAIGWDDNWDCICNDGTNEYRHTVIYGMTRSGFLRDSVEWAIPKKPDTLPEPPYPGDNMDERCNQAERLMSNQEWDKALDLLYFQQFPSDKRHRQLLERFYDQCIINRLRPDQVERLKEDSMESDSPTACFLYGYWLIWNATHFEQLVEVERCATTAARAGYGDMWMLLRYMWKFGENITASIDNDKAEYFEDEALNHDSMIAFKCLVIDPLLFGDSADPQKALQLVQERIDADGGIEHTSPQMLTLLGNCHFALGNMHDAEKLAIKAIDKGLIDSAYRLLYKINCPNEEDVHTTKAQELFDAGSIGGSSFCLYLNGYITEKKAEEETDPVKKQELGLKARLFYEKAALLGDEDACWALALGANNEDNTGFYYGRETKDRCIDCYPFFLRGAMAGNHNCAYWLYRMQMSALDSDEDPTAKEYNLPHAADHSSPSVWRSYAQSLYQAMDEPWPDDDDDYEDDDYED